MTRTVTEHDGEPAAEVQQFPRPRIEKSRWTHLLIWIVPLLMLGALAYYIHRFVTQRGTEIRVTFADANGLRVGQTPLSVRGVQVGMVSGLTLSDDQQHAVVHFELTKAYEFIAKTNTTFWIVRPDVSGGVVSGFSTVTSGPYIEALPGAGDPTTDFNGMERRPILFGDGTRIVIHAAQLKHLQLNSPVLYRGLQVGTVQDIRFSDDTTQVNATLFIWKHYTSLVTTHSEFWSVGGTDVKGGVFSGLQVQIDSLRTLIAGGVEFATPDDGSGEPIVSGQQFVLHDEPKDEWLKWEPRIKLPNDDMPSSGNGTHDLGEASGLRAAEHIH